MTRSITTQTESSIFTTPRWPSSRRTHSLSSSSSASSASSDSLPPSPATPLRRYTAGGGGVPFSWESIPGIPKNTQIILPSIDRKLAGNHLPLPPPAAAKPGRKGNYENVTRRGMEKDPFFTALVECSKGVGVGGGTTAEEEDAAAAVDKDVFGGSWKSGGRSLLMGSCKSASDIAESLVLLPRRGRIQTRTRRIGYEMMKK